ncbi:MAG: hypothetical protein ACU843_18630 [Gammaproteobacteria bacterium]
MSVLAPCAAIASEYLPLAELPPDVIPFVEAGTLPIALEQADLNGDGRQDYILVLEPRREEPQQPDESERPLLVLVREPDGTLQLAKRNRKIVLCSACGGVLGDPFQGVTARRKSFEVFHYGGSRDRWGIDFKFNYSRRDKTWQLVRVKEFNFDAFDPDTQQTTIYMPPKAYGKIDIADFDPDHWKEQGER